MKRAIYLLFIIYILIIKSVYGQIEDYEIINFSVEEGLPSNECHDVVQDSLGYIWIATDRGLSRFDGYGFKNYGKKEGLGDLACLKLFLDRHNNIWISTIGKKIYKYISKSDTIVPYEYNHLLLPYYSKTTYILMHHLDACDDVYFEVLDNGILKITNGGKLILPDTINIKPSQCYSYEIEEKFMLGISPVDLTSKRVTLNMGMEIDISTVNHKGNVFSLKYDLDQKKFGNPRAFNYSNSNYIYCVGGYHYFFHDKSLEKIKIGNEINDILTLENGWILTAQIFRQGVKAYKNNDDFMDDRYIPFFNNISASRFLKDNQHNIFISTIEDGFYYLKKKTIKPIDLGIYSQKVINRLVKKDANNLIFLVDEKTVVEKNLENIFVNEIYKSQGNILDINYDSKFSEILIAGSFNIIISENKNQTLIGFCNDNNKYGNGSFRLIPLYNKLLSLSYSKFGIYSDMRKTAMYCSEKILPGKRFISGSDYKNDSYLLGALDGLFIFDGNRLIKTDSIHPIFRSRINDIKSFKGKFLLGTLGHGLGIWDGKKNISIIQKSDGILTDNIERIYVDGSSDVYLCSKSGLSKISFRSDTTYHIQNYTRHHGLSSNIVNDVLRLGDSLYIATAKGLCVLATEPINELAKIPVIERMTINDSEFKMRDMPKKLAHDENNISFQFKSLDLSMSGDILYHIRLNEGEWIETKSTTINYLDINPGKYIFQVKANNRDFEWSTATTHDFEIKKPWWQTWFYRISSIFFISFIAYSFYKNRIGQLQKENSIQKELISLERSALQAQMNPHFIFNCLNSIQNYIMLNDKDMAMDYLWSFSRLIRQYLNASTMDVVTLDDEISMLENYLKLEQMRFNHSFDYRFEVADHIDKSSVNLPPLLIQPFVENAVLHGMAALKSDGHIIITMNQEDKMLQVKIKDNGKGFKQEKPNEMRRSLGISITQKRLQYINDHAEGNYTINTKSNENGTEINIVISIQ